MNPIQWEQVHFSYDSSWAIDRWSLTIPTGVTALVGPNGAGKSTFLLLSSGRILPVSGQIWLQGQATQQLNDDDRNRLCSLVYQNMEFETEEPLGDLLAFVLEQGYHKAPSSNYLSEVIQAFELDALLHRPTQALSKGEMQRAVMAFSLLYGSQVVVMDEPVFALEDQQKHRALEFIVQTARAQGRSFVYSVHEFELSRRYSDMTLLFSGNQAPKLGLTADLMRPEILEQAFQVPFRVLKEKESLYRAMLKNRETLVAEGLEPPTERI